MERLYRLTNNLRRNKLMHVGFTTIIRQADSTSAPGHRHSPIATCRSFMGQWDDQVNVPADLQALSIGAQAMATRRQETGKWFGERIVHGDVADAVLPETSCKVTQPLSTGIADVDITVIADPL